MRFIILLFLIILNAPFLKAQYQVEIQIEEFPDSHIPTDTIYLSGNFNFWSPADTQYILFQNHKGVYSTTISYDDLPGDRLEFKFTRGSWQKSECTKNGRLTEPRSAVAYQDLTIQCKIDGWRDYFPVSTASANVKTLDSAFYIPQLDRSRHIWIYLPPDYEKSNRRYPVLYMHDGQHLFDEATSVGRIGPIEWSVDETLDNFPHAGIVVGINHHDDMEERITEYYFRPPDQYTAAEGKEYLDFIAYNLKPFVDSSYRTLPAPAHTGICGSSMGGLISLYAGINYPEIFGKVAAFSPSIWMDKGNLEVDIERAAQKGNPYYEQQKYFLYTGDNEVRLMEDNTFLNMEEDILKIKNKIYAEISPSVDTLIKSGGRHGALYWKQAFPIFYKWFILDQEL